MVEMSKECKNNNGIPLYKEGDKQKVENYIRISLLRACYKLHINFFKTKNLKREQKSSLWSARMDSEKADLASVHCIL